MVNIQLLFFPENLMVKVIKIYSRSLNVGTREANKIFKLINKFVGLFINCIVTVL